MHRISIAQGFQQGALFGHWLGAVGHAGPLRNDQHLAVALKHIPIQLVRHLENFIGQGQLRDLNDFVASEISRQKTNPDGQLTSLNL